MIASSEGDYHVILHIWRAADGSLGGVLDSLDQEEYGIELDSVVIRDSDLSFTLPAVIGSYEGMLDTSRSQIKGMWKQSGASLKLDLARAAIDAGTGGIQH